MLGANVFVAVETKELKRRVRDFIQPGRDLGHVDRKKDGDGLVKQEKSSGEGMGEGKGEGKGERKGQGRKDAGEVVCEDCELQT